jgi:hypothetical protein
MNDTGLLETSQEESYIYKSDKYAHLRKAHTAGGTAENATHPTVN